MESCPYNCCHEEGSDDFVTLMLNPKLNNPRNIYVYADIIQDTFKCSLHDKCLESDLIQCVECCATDSVAKDATGQFAIRG